MNPTKPFKDKTPLSSAPLLVTVVLGSIASILLLNALIQKKVDKIIEIPHNQPIYEKYHCSPDGYFTDRSDINNPVNRPFYKCDDGLRLTKTQVLADN